jgi:hypothetical protein
MERELPSFGFKWFEKGKFFWIYLDEITKSAAKFLSEYDVDISILDGMELPETIEAKPPATPAAPKEDRWIIDKSSIRTNQALMPRQSSWDIIPENPNIFSASYPVSVDGKDLTLHFQIGRRKKNSAKTIAIYEMKISVDGKEVRSTTFEAPGRWAKSGPNFDENDLIARKINNVLATMTDNKEQSKTYKAIWAYLEKQKDDPEYKQLVESLKAAKTYDEQKELMKKIGEFSITIDDPKYGGTYPVKVDGLQYGSLHLDTAIDHKLAPTPKTLVYDTLPITIHTIEEIKEYVKKVIEEQKEQIQKRYIEYLSSFAYFEEEGRETSEQMNVIMGYITSKLMDTDFFIRELGKRGYIRPRKKKTQTPGMVVDGDVVLIIDDKKIRDDTYAWNKNRNSPEYFWTALAYYVMRIKHNNISFMPIALIDALRAISENAKRYGHSISYREVDSYIESLARKIYTEVTGAVYRSREENMRDFYGQSFGGAPGGSQGASGQFVDNSSGSSDATALEAFVNFAKNLGFDENLARINPKSTYRQISLKYHPDMVAGTPEEKDAAGKTFSEAASLYDELPDNIRNANNWFVRAKYAGGEI